MDIAISPCPNDTFLFSGWLLGYVGKEIVARTHFADIEQLNLWALEGRFPLIKVSIACFKEIAEEYELLPIGCALGFQTGPKLIAKAPFPIEELSSKTVAIPGRLTTANLLFDLLIASYKKKHFCLYHEIFSLLKSGVVDAGVVIHESRFTFRKEGFCEIADLGNLWEEKTALPLPLGALAIKREIPEKTKSQLIDILKKSLAFARAFPEKCHSFICEMAQEKELDVISKHIETYVNSETESLSEKGRLAIEMLLKAKKDYVKKADYFCSPK